MVWYKKHSISPNGRSNQNNPNRVWLYSLCTFMRMKYSKSGVMLPTISPVAESHCLLRNAKGRMIAGCEKVKGIVMVSKNKLFVLPDEVLLSLSRLLHKYAVPSVSRGASWKILYNFSCGWWIGIDQWRAVVATRRAGDGDLSGFHPRPFPCISDNQRKNDDFYGSTKHLVYPGLSCQIKQHKGDIHPTLV